MPTWAKEQGFENNKAAIAGATLFAESGCLNCHTYLGSGSSNLGAPDLSAIGTNGKTAEQFAKYVANPSGLRQQHHAAVREGVRRGVHRRSSWRRSGEFLFSSKGPSGGG